MMLLNTKPGVIFEFKRYDEEDEETIEEKQYDTELISRGIKDIISYNKINQNLY